MVFQGTKSGGRTAPFKKSKTMVSTNSNASTVKNATSKKQDEALQKSPTVAKSNKTGARTFQLANGNKKRSYTSRLRARSYTSNKSVGSSKGSTSTFATASAAAPAVAPAAAATTDGTHLIRVNVLGLAGVTVERNKCRDRATARKELHPAPPSAMRAVVAFSRASQIRGTTMLSKALTRSPNDDVVVAGGSPDDNNDSGDVQRHVAVWAGDDGKTLGSMVSFDASLSKRVDADISEGGVGRNNLSHFAPQSFELTIALTEHTKTESKVALPFGVANLNISGDECPSGETIIRDLPILTLQQARPLASNKNGLGGYQMIAIRPKDSDNADGTDASRPAKKKNGFKRLFGIGSSHSHASSGNESAASSKAALKIPSIAERKLFTEAYSTDPSGDAILRVQLQVLERGTLTFDDVQEKSKIPEVLPQPGSGSPKSKLIKSIQNKSKRKLTGNKSESKRVLEIATSDVATVNGDGVADVPITAGALAGAQDAIRVSSRAVEVEGGTRNSSDADETATIQSSGSASFLTNDDTATLNTLGSVLDPTIVGGVSVERSFGNSDENDDDDDGTYDVNYEGGRGPPNNDRAQGDLDATIILFGKSVQLPTCGLMAHNGDGEKAFGDDMTHVTADFFGRDVQLPICAAMKPDDDDTVSALDRNDSFSTMEEGSVDTRKKNRKTMLKKYLRSQMVEGSPAKSAAAMYDREGSVADASRDDGGTFCTDDGEEVTLNDESLLSETDGEETDGEGTYDDGTFEGTYDDGTFEGTFEGTYDNTYDDGTQQEDSYRNDEPPITFKSKGSPKGVADLEEDDASGREGSSAPSSGLGQAPQSFARRLVDLFNCQVNTVSDHRVGEIDKLRVLVPDEVVPTDDRSVGELTANTYERKINTRELILQQMKEQEILRNAQKKSRLPILLPVAFGGSGVCPTVALVDNAAVEEEVERVATQDAADNSLVSGSSRQRLMSNGVDQPLQPLNEDYFREYDSYNFKSQTNSGPTERC